MIPDAHSFRAGVTTFVDAGTAGADHFADFKRRWIDTSRTRILAFVNIARGAWARRSRTGPAPARPRRRRRGGAPGRGGGDQDGPLLDQQALGRGAPTLDLGGRRRAHRRALPPPRDGGLLAPPPGAPLPRPDPGAHAPGDIHTHVFAQQFPILTEEGRDRPNPRVADHVAGPRAGRPLRPRPRRGQLLVPQRHSGHPSGLPPDSISTDLHMGSVNAAVLNTLHTPPPSAWPWGCPCRRWSTAPP